MLFFIYSFIHSFFIVDNNVFSKRLLCFLTTLDLAGLEQEQDGLLEKNVSKHRHAIIDINDHYINEY